MNSKFIVFVGLLVALAIEQRGIVEADGSVEATCTNGWKAYGAQCYKVNLNHLPMGNFTIQVFEEIVDQQGAVDKCLAEKAELVSIHSVDENKFVEGKLNYFKLKNQKNSIKGLARAAANSESGISLWIGLKITRNSAKDVTINCHWVDGSPMNYGNVNDFGAGTQPWGHFPEEDPEPNNKGQLEECVVFKVEGTLTVMNCFENLVFINSKF
jgi:hypothetical protein